MATFKLKYAGSVVPVEEVTLTDGQDKVSAINSTIDKILGGNITKNFGTVPENVQYREYNNTASYAYADNLFSNLPQTISFLFVRIKQALGSSEPDCRVTLSGGAGTEIYLSGLNDFCIVGVNTDALSLGFKSSNSNTLAKVEILLAGT